MLKKSGKVLFLVMLMGMILAVSAFASGEPGASGEPAAEASDEPAAADELASFDVTINVNGIEFTTVQVGIAVDGNTYTFQIAELLEAVGMNLSYDEQADTALITAEPGSLTEVFLKELETADGTDKASDEMGASDEPIVGASEEPGASGEPNAAGVSGGEDEAAAEPATEEAFEAYRDYLVEYMTNYDGVGDGSFDESARAMALGEMDSVAFGADVNAFPFEMYVTQFGAKDYAAFAASG